MRMQNVLYKLFVICIIKDLSEHKMVMHLIFFATRFQVQGNAINLSLKEFDGTHKNLILFRRANSDSQDIIHLYHHFSHINVKLFTLKSWQYM